VPGIIYLIIWSLIWVVSIKYLWFILKADNHDQGGIIARAARLNPWNAAPGRRRIILMAILLMLLAAQSHATTIIGALSASIMRVWGAALEVMGIGGISHQPTHMLVVMAFHLGSVVTSTDKTPLEHLIPTGLLCATAVCGR
jgi:K+ transporter